MRAIEECLLDPERQVRNPGFGRREYEDIFRDVLGATNVIWLGRGVAGDDTHGHVDDISRFVGPRTLVAWPASYANFYMANAAAIVPTFNDPGDRTALGVLAELIRDRPVVGIHAVDLVWGLGTLHCLTQRQPAA